MIARLSALDATFAPRGPQERHHGETLRIIIDRKPTKPPYRQLQDQHRLVETAVQCQRVGAVSTPDGRARCHEAAAAKG
jgi:hypothetical protein